MLDARAWLLWAAAVLVVASSTRNPLYALLLLAIVVAADAVCARGERRGLPSPLRFAAVAVPLAAAFSGLTLSIGATVLVRLPASLPLVGGAITLEALVFGATNGVVLAAIYGGFSHLNRVTQAHDLLRLAPRALHEAGVVLSIALTFIPQTQRSLARIREAQALRGHRVRGLRDWLPITTPLLVSGLERSMGLAEAMVSRGYGAVAERGRPLGVQALWALGLLAILTGWLGRSFVPSAALWGTVTLAAGAVLLAAGLWRAGRGVTRTRYRPAHWGARESLVAAGAALTVAAVLAPLPAIDRAVLAYAPFPRLAWPPIDPLLALAFLGLLAPIVLALASRGREP
jgi:energy-coupling factor transport system permease protein